MDRESCRVHDRCLGLRSVGVEGVGLVILHEGVRTDTVCLFSTVDLVCF
jgi:hypothetical protein